MKTAQFMKNLVQHRASEGRTEPGGSVGGENGRKWEE